MLCCEFFFCLVLLLKQTRCFDLNLFLSVSFMLFDFGFVCWVGEIAAAVLFSGFLDWTVVGQLFFVLVENFDLLLFVLNFAMIFFYTNVSIHLILSFVLFSFALTGMKSTLTLEKDKKFADKRYISHTILNCAVKST